MTDDIEVARIAAGLTKAQRRWIALAEPNRSLGGALATYPPSQTCQVLHRLGLWLWCGALTQSGLRVKAYLESKGGDA